jgi:hypothetical protein
MSTRDYLGKHRIRRRLITIAATAAAGAAPLLAGVTTSASAGTVTQVGSASVIASMTPNHSLYFYWQSVGTKTWHRELVAGPRTTYSAPSVTRVGNSSVIAAQGPANSLDFYWQTIGTKPWNCELVQGTTHCP